MQKYCSFETRGGVIFRAKGLRYPSWSFCTFRTRSKGQHIIETCNVNFQKSDLADAGLSFVFVLFLRAN